MPKGPVTLSVNNPFVQLGTSATFQLNGHPCSVFLLYLSTAPAEIPLGPAGTLFMAPGTLIPFTGGSWTDPATEARRRR